MDIRRYFARARVTQFPEDDFDFVGNGNRPLANDKEPNEKKNSCEHTRERCENPAGAVFAEEDGKLVAFSLPSVFRGATPVHDPLALDLHPEDIHDMAEEPRESFDVHSEKPVRASVPAEENDRRSGRKRHRDALEEKELRVYWDWEKRRRAMEGGTHVKNPPGEKELRERVARQRKSVHDWSARVEAAEVQLQRLRQSLSTEVARLQQLEDALAAAHGLRGSSPVAPG